jgi:hypothetical protein
MTPFSQLEVNGRFGGKCCLRLQDRKISYARNQRKTGGKQILQRERLSYHTDSRDITGLKYIFKW